MAFVDTNVLLRWLLADHATLSSKAESLIENAQPGTLIVTDIVMAEIVYVLRGTGRDRQQTSEALLLIGRTAAFKYEYRDVAMEVIALLVDTRLDFADCYLLARARQGKQELITFDAALRKSYTRG